MFFFWAPSNWYLNWYPNPLPLLLTIWRYPQKWHFTFCSHGKFFSSVRRWVMIKLILKMKSTHQIGLGNTFKITFLAHNATITPLTTILGSFLENQDFHIPPRTRLFSPPRGVESNQWPGKMFFVHLRPVDTYGKYFMCFSIAKMVFNANFKRKVRKSLLRYLGYQSLLLLL